LTMVKRRQERKSVGVKKVKLEDELKPFRRTKPKLGKVPTSMFVSMSEGLYFKYGQPDEKFWPYPIFLGNKTHIPSLSPEPLRVEFKRRGKIYLFMFYHPKKGLVGYSKVSGHHRTYIMRELISRKGNVKRGGEVDINFIGTILDINQHKLQDMVETMQIKDVERP